MQTENIFNLIGLWREREPLWNMRSPLYRRNDIKNKSYEEIADEIGMSEDEVKKKLKSLRSVYFAEKKKVDASKASGASADAVYEPNIPWYAEMAFLDNCIIKRQTKSNTNESDYYSEDAFQERPESSKKSKKTDDDGLDKAIKTLIDVNNKSLSKFQSFGDSVAQQLNDLPKKEAYVTMAEIQNLLTQKLIHVMQNPTILDFAITASDLIEEVYD